MAIKNRIAEFHAEVTGWRQHLHRQPELGFDTVETGQFVAGKLREFGCDDVIQGMARNGVVGIIHGKSRESGRVVGLRADMDALPILEQTGLDYASSREGKMHACGHDGHTAMLLGAARYLAETRNFDGSVALVFQPAEEGEGGGKVMCDEGLIERFGIAEIYGMHNMPGLPVGTFAIRPGAFFAATDEIDIRLIGHGSHAAWPHQSIDPTVLGAQLVTALQTITSRNIAAGEQAVVSICSFRTSSDAHNVIPSEVRLRGTIRTLSEGVRDQIKTRVEQLTRSLAEGFGARAEVTITPGYPVMVNAGRETGYAAEAGALVAGSPTETYPVCMGGEDFAYMLNECPGAYILVGNGDTETLHHDEYNFNDDAIPFGASYWATLVESRLPSRV